MKRSEEIKDIATALSKAQGEIAGAKKDSSNPFFKSMYADLESVREAMRGPFAKHGLSISQEPLTRDGLTYLGAFLAHSSGQWFEYEPVMVPVKEEKNPQSLKSGITYMRRAQLLAICGMSEADDDGIVASGQNHQNTPANTAPSAQSSPKNEDNFARPYTQPPGGSKLTEKQIGRLWAIAKSSGYSNDVVFKMLTTIGGVKTPEELTKQNYDRICEALSIKNAEDEDKIPF